MGKEQIRKEILAKRRGLTTEEIQRESHVICRRIQSMDAFQKTEALYAYMDCKGEASVRELMEEAFRQGKRVAVPRVEGQEMKFYYIQSFEECEPGYFGIPEPVTGREASDEDALLIMPGVAFDEKRHRVGYGKGFYDRYLSRHRKHTTIAVALDFQIVEEIPADEYDILPQRVVTGLRTISEGMLSLEEIGSQAQEAKPLLQQLDTARKNRF